MFSLLSLRRVNIYRTWYKQTALLLTPWHLLCMYVAETEYGQDNIVTSGKYLFGSGQTHTEYFTVQFEADIY